MAVILEREAGDQRKLPSESALASHR
jgi:hypothetical protein